MHTGTATRLAIAGLVTAAALGTATSALLAQSAPKAAQVEPVTRKSPSAAPVVQAQAAAPKAAAAAPSGPANTHEIVVTVIKVQPLDRLDLFSKADLFARVTIAGKEQSVPPAKGGASDGTVTPNWVFKQAVPAGKVPIRLELFDKDLTRNEPIDINRVNGKRFQDFSVDTGSCRISGFAGSPKCGDVIARAGEEPKKAQISFTVDVKPLAK
jgi:hypothetical protein